jgi:hypothetical protein
MKLGDGHSPIREVVPVAEHYLHDLMGAINLIRTKVGDSPHAAFHRILAVGVGSHLYDEVFNMLWSSTSIQQLENRVGIITTLCSHFLWGEDQLSEVCESPHALFIDILRRGYTFDVDDLGLSDIVEAPNTTCIAGQLCWWGHDKTWNDFSVYVGEN